MVPAPTFTATDSGNALFSDRLSYKLVAYADPQCQTPFSGVVDGLEVSEVEEKEIRFPQIRYSLPSSLEKKFYLGLSEETLGLSYCSTAVHITHRFSAGVGFTRFNVGGPATAGGSGAARYDLPYHGSADAEGRMLIAGSNSNGTYRLFAGVWRFNPDGSPDTTFGTNGGAFFPNAGLPLGGANSNSAGDTILQVRSESSGRILLAGYSQNVLLRREILIMALQANGSLDTSFGGGAGYVFFSTWGQWSSGGFQHEQERRDQRPCRRAKRKPCGHRE